jgi:hypothetical protein
MSGEWLRRSDSQPDPAKIQAVKTALSAAKRAYKIACNDLESIKPVSAREFAEVKNALAVSQRHLDKAQDEHEKNMQHFKAVQARRAELARAQAVEGAAWDQLQSSVERYQSIVADEDA